MVAGGGIFLRFLPYSRAHAIGSSRQIDRRQDKMKDSVLAQSIQITSSRLLTAMPDGRSWLVELSSSLLTALPISPIAMTRSSVTASLVEGAISAGLTQTGFTPSVGSRTSLPGYIRWLVGNYVFAGQTPG